MPRPAILGPVLAVGAAGAMLARPTTAVAPGGIVDPPGSVLILTGVALGLLLAGVTLAAFAGPQGPALLTLIVAGAFVAGVTTGATGPPAVVSSLAAVAAFAGMPALMQLALGWPKARPSRIAERRLVVSIWILVAGAAIAWVLVWDPYSDVGCVLACGENPLAIHADARSARSLMDLCLAATLAAGAFTAAVTMRPSRFWPAGTAVLVLAVEAAMRLQGRGRIPDAFAIPLYQARCASLAVVGIALIATAVGRLRRHQRMVRLAATLNESPAPGTFAASLAEALGDPSLAIGYAMAGQDRYVHADGFPFDGPNDRQVTTRLERNGTPIAMIVHGPEHAEAITSGLGAAVRLAIDNERLQADRRSKLADLRVSRARVVERSDAERLRLERDLHDGAQQRLLMLAHQLRLSLQQDPDASSWLVPVIDDVDAAVSELREIAHGIYPGILESLGLHAALDSLADGPVPFTLNAAPSERLDAPVERAAYLVVVTALSTRAGSRESDSSPVSAALSLEDGWLTVRLAGVRGLREVDIEGMADNVGALGGKIAFAGDTIVSTLPCE